MGSSDENSSSSGGAAGGIGLGSILAFIVSYCTWHSIGWGIVHGIFSWAYLLYFAIRYTEILKGYLDHLFGMF